MTERSHLDTFPAGRARRILGTALLWLDHHVLGHRWYPLCWWSEAVYGPLTEAEMPANWPGN